MHNGVDPIPDYFFLGFSLELRAAATIKQWASLRGRNNSTYHTLPMSVEEGTLCEQRTREGHAGRGRRARFLLLLLLLASYFFCCCCSGRAPYKPNRLMNVFFFLFLLLFSTSMTFRRKKRFTWRIPFFLTVSTRKRWFSLKVNIVVFSLCVFKNVEFLKKLKNIPGGRNTSFSLAQLLFIIIAFLAPWRMDEKQLFPHLDIYSL